MSHEDLFKKLLDLASAGDKTKLKLSSNCLYHAMKDCEANPGSSTLVAMSKANNAHEETVKKMADKYLTASEQEPESERFRNRKQALNWLQDQGHKVSQDKFYYDCRGTKDKPGFPPVNKDGSVSKWMVMEYGQKLAAKTIGPSTGMDKTASAENDARKLKAEADIAEMKAERMRREEDKYWLHADEAWATLAALIGTLRDAIRHQLHEGAREVIYLAGGDQDRSHEVFEGVDQMVNMAFNEVADNGVNVEFEREE